MGLKEVSSELNKFTAWAKANLRVWANVTNKGWVKTGVWLLRNGIKLGLE